MKGTPPNSIMPCAPPLVVFGSRRSPLSVWFPVKVLAPGVATAEQLNGSAVSALPALHPFAAMPRVMLLPNVTPEPPVRPLLVEMVNDGLVSMALVIPPAGTLRLNVPDVPPPVSPLPDAVVIPVIVPDPVPGNVWPVAKVIWPLLLIFSPVSVAFAGATAKSRFNVAEGEVVLLPTGSACQWKTWLVDAALPLL